MTPTSTSYTLTVTDSTHSANSFNDITMINSSGAVKAQPGALRGGNSLTVAWERAS